MRLDTERLRYEMAIRGLNGETLARASGISKNTTTRALRGDDVTPRTLRRLASALLTYPPLQMAEDLVARPVATKDRRHHTEEVSAGDPAM